MTRHLRLLLGLALAIALSGFSASATASPPANVVKAQKSFDEFATTWIVKLNKSAETQRRKASAGMDFRRYSEEFTTELQTTGNDAVPYVGVLRYDEHLYHCTGSNADCQLVKVSPITEMFPFSGGKWSY